MINKNRVLALIPARGGSKGIKNKNIVDLKGMPLIGYTIVAALKSKYIDSVVVSTDSKKIGDISKKMGVRVPFLRPKELATDKAKTIDVVTHAINKLNDNRESYDILVLLQPTQPLRSVHDIDSALESFVENNYVGLVSVSEIENHPILTLFWMARPACYS